MVKKTAILMALSGANVFCGECPSLDFYFDVNKTIIMSDAVSGKTEADVIAGMFAEYEPKYALFGMSGKETYYDFITQDLEANGFQGQALKEQRNIELQFTLTEIKKKLNSKKKAELEQRVAKIESILLESKLYFGLIPSFISFLKALSKQKEYPYRIIFRTFGTDFRSIKQGVRTLFPHKDIDFVDGTFKGDEFIISEDLRYPRLDFHLIFSKHPAHTFFTFTDEYDFWKKTGFIKKGGKPFPIFFDQEQISIFFDDNVNLGIILPYDGHTQSTEIDSDLLQSVLRGVNPLQATENENYYIEEFEALKQKIASKLLHRK